MSINSPWKVNPLHALTSLIKDGSHGTHRDVDQGVPLLSAKDIRNGQLDIPADCRRISERDYDSIHAKYTFRGDDILLTIVGSIGRRCRLTGTEPRFTIQRSVAVLRPDGIDSSYLYHYFASETFQKQLETLTNASAQGGVYLGALAECSVAYPECRTEQSKIAEILSTVDRAIEQTEALIAKKQRIKTGLMQDLLIRGIDENGTVRSEATHKFKGSPLGQIPEEWDVTSATDLCDAVLDCKNRTPPLADEGHPVIRTPNVRGGQFVFADLVYTDPHSYEVWVTRGRPRPGDVVITREAPFGEACQIPIGLESACLGQRMMMYQTNQAQLRADYLVLAIYSEVVQSKLLELAGGSTVGHIRVGDIRKLPIPHPKSIDEQKRISDVLTGAALAIDSLCLQRDKLRLVKAGLMQDLLTGTRRVTAVLGVDSETVGSSHGA